MKLEREWVESLVFGSRMARRFTQDSPVLPDVWLDYAELLDQPLGLLLTPYRSASPGELSRELLQRLGDQSQKARLAYNQSAVVADLSFQEMVRNILPLSSWWERHITRKGEEWLESILPRLSRPDMLARLFGTSRDSKARDRESRDEDQTKEPSAEAIVQVSDELHVAPEVLWMVRLVGTLIVAQETEVPAGATLSRRTEAWERLQSNPLAIVNAVTSLFRELQELGLLPRVGEKPLLWSVSRNRPAIAAVWSSVPSVKADAAFRLFDVSCKDLTWAVLDSGIDATHWAFRQRDRDQPGKPPYAQPFENTGQVQRDGTPIWKNHTRIKATYDFRLIRNLLDVSGAEGGNRPLPPEVRRRLRHPRLREQIGHLRQSLQRGQEVDWTLLAPLLEVPHDPERYQAPVHEHGTHVAGILAADWAPERNSVTDGEIVRGICPDINIYDLRVLDDSGEGDEFSIIAALQFVRYLNAHKDFVAVHGVNVSLSIRHDVANYACGRTPVCEECERLVGAGTPVVAAAGNEGYLQYMTSGGVQEGYRSISITDPGNAQNVITVGSTHRSLPHTYGVSYFSSRGPTGDGRLKPDLVAPGEKVESCVPGNDIRRMDGTSMAAPHVSGAAALLMARHRELVGSPSRIKQILCETATDLGRERYFQGAGMVDILRALQSI